MHKLLILLAFVLGAQSSLAAGLTIHAAELGVGKFHRHDNKAHAYSDDNVWKAFVLPDGADEKTPLIVQNKKADDYTIFFSTLEELLRASVKLSQDSHKQIAILNINGHGLPGGMWYPKDEKTKNSYECFEWRNVSMQSDEVNYNGYYSAVSKEEILQFRRMSESPSVRYSCVTGMNEWQEITSRIPNLKEAFAPDAQVHLLSCIVGLGLAGENLTKKITELLISSSEGRVETSLMFGLGDWSMPQGMGFWDYQTDQQLNHDNDIYPVDRKDSEIMQKGTIRVVSPSAKGGFAMGMIADTDYLYLHKDTRGPSWRVPFTPIEQYNLNPDMPESVRIPGTAMSAWLKR